jgi:predicted nucleotidyltransferase component of viral defense system
MITRDQIAAYAKQFKTNEATVLREYLQLLFLNTLYNQPQSKNVFFKGGTAIHFIYHAPRFSEDLDFTVGLTDKDFQQMIDAVFSALISQNQLIFKQQKTLAGKRFVLNSQNVKDFPPSYIHLDFSFRENVLEPQKTIITTPYPILFSSYVHHLSIHELFSEKIRAIMTRRKGRDLYDLWFLSTNGASIKHKLIQQKLDYYHMTLNHRDLVSRIQSFPKNDFILDLKPFVTFPERDTLNELYEYIQAYCRQSLM